MEGRCECKEKGKNIPLGIQEDCNKTTSICEKCNPTIAIEKQNINVEETTHRSQEMQTRKSQKFQGVIVKDIFDYQFYIPIQLYKQVIGLVQKQIASINEKIQSLEDEISIGFLENFKSIDLITKENEVILKLITICQQIEKGKFTDVQMTYTVSVNAQYNQQLRGYQFRLKGEEGDITTVRGMKTLFQKFIFKFLAKVKFQQIPQYQ